jgi:hypothetical protein
MLAKVADQALIVLGKWLKTQAGMDNEEIEIKVAITILGQLGLHKARVLLENNFDKINKSMLEVAKSTKLFEKVKKTLDNLAKDPKGIFKKSSGENNEEN